MKKLSLLVLMTVFTVSVANAQDDDKMLFNHWSVGVTSGTPGLIGFDVATTCTPYLQVRAGLAIMPNFKYSTDIKLSDSDVSQFNNARSNINDVMDRIGEPNAKVVSNVEKEYGVEGKFGFTNGKILFDVFPFKSTNVPVFVTVGAYFGSSKIINVYNTTSLDVVNQANYAIGKYNAWIDDNSAQAQTLGYTKVDEIYAHQGEYTDLGPDANGDVEFAIKVNGFKPYLGIGFGRPVPKKNRVGFQVELGCMFWSTPKVTFHGNKDFELEKDKAGDEDVGKAIDIISKFSVWPCLNFRICGRIL